MKARPIKPAPGTLCVPHRERKGIELPADIVIAGTPMCLACFRGRAVDPLEDHYGFPFFLADALTGSKAQAHAHGKGAGRGEAA